MYAVSGIFLYVKHKLEFTKVFFVHLVRDEWIQFHFVPNFLFFYIFNQKKLFELIFRYRHGQLFFVCVYGL